MIQFVGLAIKFADAHSGTSPQGEPPPADLIIGRTLRLRARNVVETNDVRRFMMISDDLVAASRPEASSKHGTEIFLFTFPLLLFAQQRMNVFTKDECFMRSCKLEQTPAVTGCVD